MFTYFIRYVFIFPGWKSWGWEGLWRKYSPASALMSMSSDQWLIFQTTCWTLQSWSSLSPFIPVLFFILQFRNFCATTLGQYFPARLLQTRKKNSTLSFLPLLKYLKILSFLYTPLNLGSFLQVEILLGNICLKTVLSVSAAGKRTSLVLPKIGAASLSSAMAAEKSFCAGVLHFYNYNVKFSSES